MKKESPHHHSTSFNKYKAQSQKDKVYCALFNKPMTSLMLSNELGILRANVCRYIAKLEQDEKILAVTKSLCPISRHLAKFYASVRTLPFND